MGTTCNMMLTECLVQIGVCMRMREPPPECNDGSRFEVFGFCGRAGRSSPRPPISAQIHSQTHQYSEYRINKFRGKKRQQRQRRVTWTIKLWACIADDISAPTA
jgi:hypothetical protein